MRSDTDQIIHLKDYVPYPYKVPQVDLNIEIGPETTRAVCLLTIEPADGTPVDTPLVLDGEELTLASIAIDGAPLAQEFFETGPHGLTIFSPPPRRFILETEVFLAPERNTELMGLYRSNGIWCTQCEAEGFRRITYYPDRPDVLSRYRVRMEADKALAPVLLANGNPRERGDLPEGRHYAVWEDPFPKPSYLFAMVAGDLGSIHDSFTTRSGKTVALGIYCEPGKEERCTYAMEALKRAMAWDEQRFGREYDLEVFNIVAVPDFNFGAMENKGLNIFNDRYVLADPEIATDADYAHIESVIAHEYFHNWTGNRVTCRDWFQLCLKEGLTVYRDQEFTSDERSRPVKRIEDVRALRMAQFPEDSGPLAHPARPEQYREINNFYTATVYDKGAEIVRMLATLIGPEAFRKGTDLYFERHDGEATTIEAWLKVFEDSSGRDLGHFARWYHQAGTPEVTVSEDWDRSAQTYTLTLRQETPPTPGQPDKAPLTIPVRFGLIGPNGDAASWTKLSGGQIDGDMIVLDDVETKLVFEGMANRPVASLFRGFSAPVKLRSTASQEDWLFLARHDSDPFNRWQALQNAAMTLMVDAVHNGGAFNDRKSIRHLASALADTLENDALDDAFKAHALSLPGEANVAQAVTLDVDPTLIHAVRRTLLRDIGTELTGALNAAYKALTGPGDPRSMSPEASRARALRNQCLALIVDAETAGAGQLARDHYAEAGNMTDRMAAISAIVAAWTPDAETLLADFRDRFGADMLVYDKWLALNAIAPDDECIVRLRRVYSEPDFPRTNPNRLRSLAGTFGMQNGAQFARADGQGFQFIAQVCREVDAHNPQVAARILTAFRSWASYEPTRRAAARAALESLASESGHSRNVSDILTRTLDSEKLFPRT